ncbi:MAG: hypothetical protein KDB96_15885 [Flavobacteriales bacterium]|nr:hypothetical protein [Flavobacteriales bacterium]MCB0786587.1 hypothetical protein [Flavobacteriales bacterium]MCB0810758.1 hypothetical protein [Flavobacteriales bacterium]MCB0812279.1 hypothetical protein [Flavobacteriales bacterium]
MLKNVRYLMVGLLLLALQAEAFAVAFKMKNDASYSIRARAYDRGAWRSWVTFNPGDWGDFAPKVERTVHTVQFEVLTSSGWKRVYQGNHGSRMFTRVVQVIEGPDGDPAFLWWDEPGGGCRDMPPHPQRGGSTCLRESGWYWDTLWSNLRKLSTAYLAGS